ncbi:MAG: ribosome silencing factor [Comamonadaceae bacterium]|nr:ribosome silencing factor [Comamonadaceae bacterium]
MDIRKLQRAIVDGLEDVKAQDIVVYNTERLSPLFERVIIASGTSNRQTKALAGSVRETVKKRGLHVLSTEGEANGEWIIVDCGAAVAHIMQPAIREYYRLEELWGGKPVKLKIAAAARLPKAAGSAATQAARATQAPTAKARVRKPATGMAQPERATTPRTAAAKASSGKAPPRAAASAAGPARAPARAPVRVPAAKKASATKTAPRKAGARPAANKPAKAARPLVRKARRG